MRILFAPDSFKGAADSTAVSEALLTGFKRIFPDLQADIMPMADGGEGSVNAFLSVLSGEERTATVPDLYGIPIKAHWGWVPDRKLAIIESAAASGLTLYAPAKRRPWQATTFGTGVLIKEAIAAGAKTIILGLGGTGTVDGGAGALQALGVRFLAQDGSEIEKLTLDTFPKVASLDTGNLAKGVADTHILIATDVENNLLGAEGAVYMFGKQKGLRDTELDKAEEAMAHYSACLSRHLGRSLAQATGSGAAGGLGYGLRHIFHTEVYSGGALLMRYANLTQRLPNYDFVVTGEGSLDQQSLLGKGPVCLARQAHEVGVPVIAFAGRVAADPSILAAAGITVAIPIASGPLALQDAIKQTSPLLTSAAERCARLLRLGHALPLSETMEIAHANPEHA